MVHRTKESQLSAQRRFLPDDLDESLLTRRPRQSFLPRDHARPEIERKRRCIHPAHVHVKGLGRGRLVWQGGPLREHVLLHSRQGSAFGTAIAPISLGGIKGKCMHDATYRSVHVVRKLPLSEVVEHIRVAYSCSMWWTCVLNLNLCFWQVLPSYPMAHQVAPASVGQTVRHRLRPFHHLVQRLANLEDAVDFVHTRCHILLHPPALRLDLMHSFLERRQPSAVVTSNVDETATNATLTWLQMWPSTWPFHSSGSE